MNDQLSKILPHWTDTITTSQGLFYVTILSAFLIALLLSAFIDDDLRDKIVFWGAIANLVILLGLVLTIP